MRGRAPKGGMVRATGDVAATTTHTQIPGLVADLDVPGGHVAIVTIYALLNASSNNAVIDLAVDGVETGFTGQSNVSGGYVPCTKQYLVGPGRHRVAAMGWMTTAAGNVYGGSGFLSWIIVPA